ncbi:putative DNA glycosylase [Helianthus debilis subsp. tardiflorus]
MMMIMEVEVSSKFKLEKAVCNHGFFMMAPNTWHPSTKTFVRPLRLLNNNTDQVKRMLRLSKEDEEAVEAFHKLHSDAADKGFGRLFRNPSLFEDIVKTFLLCASRFEDSLGRAEKLCNLNPERKRGRRKRAQVNFPTAHEVLSFGMSKLERTLGYRCDVIFDLATDVVSGRVDLDRWENSITDGDELYKELIHRKGIGNFVASNILMCIGFYQRVPLDSETTRHIKQIHHHCGVNKVTDEMVKDIYDKYAPFQTLAYWFELLEYYESKVGKLCLLEKADYKKVTGSLIEKRISSSSSSSIHICDNLVI